MATTAVSVRMRTTVHSNTARVVRRLHSNAERLASQTTTSMVDNIKRRTPVRTGYLRLTVIGHYVTGQPKGYVKVYAFYGVYVEKGTRNMAAQPFVAPGTIDAMHQVFRPGVRRLFHGA